MSVTRLAVLAAVAWLVAPGPAAAATPSEAQWFDAGHDDLPGVALRAMWRFLRGPLGLGG